MLFLLRKSVRPATAGISGRETTVPTQPQDISAALQGMRRERADHEELVSMWPFGAAVAVARADEVIE